MGWYVVNPKDNEKVKKIAKMFSIIIPNDCLVKGERLSENNLTKRQFEFQNEKWLNDQFFKPNKTFKELMEKYYGSFKYYFEPFKIEYTGSAITEASIELCDDWDKNIIWLIDSSIDYHIKLYYVLRFIK